MVCVSISLDNMDGGEMSCFACLKSCRGYSKKGEGEGGRGRGNGEEGARGKGKGKNGWNGLFFR